MAEADTPSANFWPQAFETVILLKMGGALVPTLVPARPLDAHGATPMTSAQFAQALAAS